MRRMRRMIAAVMLTLLCSGCALDVEPYLQPPRVQGQQQALQDALEAAILTDAVAQYIFKYPARGDLSSAFVLMDGAGNLCGADEAVTAVAFYALRGEKYTHLHLLRRDNDGWRSVADVPGEASDMDAAQVGDLDGDGRMELLVGWDLYSGDYQISIYSLGTDSLSVTADAGRYQKFFVGDMNADGRDELVLLRIGSRVTASLYTWTQAGEKLLNTVRLDGSIRSFDRMVYGNLTGADNALYIDATLSTGNFVTEILYWDGKQLCAPLFDPALGRTSMSVRGANVPTYDADGNGAPDYPMTSRLKSAPEAQGDQSWLWLTEWMNYDVSTGSAVRLFGSVVNRADGYFIELEDDWADTLITRYDAQSHILWLDEVQENGEAQPFLAVQKTVSSRSDPPSGYTFKRLSGSDNLRIWFDPDNTHRLTTEKISYMLVTLS